MKKKYVFLGDTNSINIEIICKSHSIIKNKVKYILIGNKIDLIKYLKKINSKLDINEILDPISFRKYDSSKLNFYNVENLQKKKSINIINQINVSNKLSSITNNDLITMPIDKSIIKKEITFNGMTEYLAKINKKMTVMLMYGNKFSVIPLTTHINLKNVNIHISKKFINSKLNNITKLIEERDHRIDIDKVFFLCVNPHCSENRTIGNEDQIIGNTIKNFSKINGPIPADSAFNNFNKKSLFISMYHDQVLIPFKILNENGINITLGLPFLRLSPAHGTARNLKYKNKADNLSFLKCMLF